MPRLVPLSVSVAAGTVAAAARLFYNLSVQATRYVPGQRVLINKSASDLYPDYVGMYGHIGIGGVAGPYFAHDCYFVGVRLETGASVILRLPEKCIDEAPTDFRL